MRAHRGAQRFAVEADERVTMPHGDALAVQMLSHQLGIRHGKQDQGCAAVDDIQADASQSGQRPRLGQLRSTTTVGKRLARQRGRLTGDCVGEALGGPGQQRHVVDASSVPRGDGMQGTVFVGGARIPAEVGHPGDQPVNQPQRRLRRADIDGEVQHAGHRGLVAVVARGGTGLTGHSTTVDVGDNGVVTETLRSSVAARPQLVIFDLDGTLTDSAQGIVSSFRHALGEVGAVVPDGDLASRIVGPPMHHTLREMGLGTDTDAAIAAYRADYSTRGWAMNRLFDGIAGLLTDLKAAGVRLAVATSKAEPTARRILAHFGLDGHFEVIAGASVDGSRATKSDVVAHALAQLHPLPDRVLMVGDRSHDVEGAAEHGIDTVVVGWGYGRDDFADPHAVSRTGTCRDHGRPS